MDSNNDPNIFSFGGTAGVNDDLRRKLEAEVHELEVTTKHANERVKEDGRETQELIKSEKHAHNEAREILQGVLDQCRSVDVDSGVVTSFHDSVTNALRGSTTINADQEGVDDHTTSTSNENDPPPANTDTTTTSIKNNNNNTKDGNIADAVRLHQASVQELHERLEKRTTELTHSGHRHRQDFAAHADLLTAIADQIEMATKRVVDEDLAGQDASMKRATTNGQAVRDEQAAKLDGPRQKAHEIAIENQQLRDRLAAATATWDETKVAHDTLLAQLHQEKSSLLGPEQALRLEIEQGKPVLETTQHMLANLVQQVTSARTFLRERSAYEAQGKVVRASHSELSAEKKRLTQEIETAGTTWQKATAASTGQTSTMVAKLDELTRELNKMEEEYPATRLEDALAHQKRASQGLDDASEACAAKVALQQEHKAACAEQRRILQDLADELNKARLKKKKLLATLGATNDDPEAAKMRSELETLRRANAAKELKIAELERSAFDNHGHQELIRKYKVLKTSRKKLDTAASLDAKIASAKAELAKLLLK